MDYAWSVSSGAAVARSCVVGATVANAGIPLVVPGAGGEGLLKATTTAGADMVGVAIDTATYTTTQSGNTDVEAHVKVIISPDAVWKVKLSGGATENTALQIFTVVTASSGGTGPALDDDVSSPEMDEGVIWGYSGSQVGKKRRIESTSTVTPTITVPFGPIVVGDQFLIAPYWFFGVQTLQLTTNLYQADASAAVASNQVPFRIVDMLLRDQGASGTTNSYIYVVSDDHTLGNRPT